MLRCKILKLRIIAIVSILCLNFFNTSAQDLPRLSPQATVEQKVGLTWITISYSRPAVRDRIIWGELIPYGHVWQMGTYEPTIIIFDNDVSINDQVIEQGQYALFMIPGKEVFRFILNSNTSQWGSFEYDKHANVFEFNVKPAISNFNENLEFSFKDFTKNTAQICLEWEKLKLCFEVKTEIKKKALENIKEAIRFSEPGDYMIYLSAINYAIETGEYLDEAERWTNDVIRISNNAWDALWARANLYARNEDFINAVKFGEKCLDTITNEHDNQELFNNYSSIIQEWEKNKK